MNDPVVLSFAFVYIFAALATIVATFGFKLSKDESEMKLSPIRIRPDRRDRRHDQR
jgi:hypothetical protein